MSRQYAMSRGMWLRLCGLMLIAVAAAVAISVTFPLIVDVPWWTPIAVAVAGCALVVLAGVVLRRAAVLAVREEGYSVRWVRGAGVRDAAWRDVADIASMSLDGDRCLVVHLNGGGRSVIPVSLLQVDPDELARELREIAQRAQRVRPIS